MGSSKGASAAGSVSHARAGRQSEDKLGRIDRYRRTTSHRSETSRPRTLCPHEDDRTTIPPTSSSSQTPNSGRRDEVEKERNGCGGRRRRLGCPVGGVMLAWMLARTDRPLIVQIGIVIGGTSRIEQRVSEAWLGVTLPSKEDD